MVLCAHGINDPLVSTLMLDYILRIQEESPIGRIMLVTEEPRGARADADVVSRMERAGIQWAPLRYDVRGAQMLQKTLNLWRLLWRAWRFVAGGRERVVVGFLSFAGSYASVLRSTGFTRSVIVNFEPHSRYMVEMGVWRKGGLKERLARWFERRQVLNADVIVAPSSAVGTYVRQLGCTARVLDQGVTIDVRSNLRRETEGRALRVRLGIADRRVLVYAGKFNGIYHGEAEYVSFMARGCAADPNVHHLIVTFPEHAEAIQRLAAVAGLEGRYTLHGPVSPEELPTWMSAADIGVIAVPPTPAQKFRSPVKSALYWAAGLPILIARGVSDDWRVAEERSVGLVVDDLTEIDSSMFKAGLDRLLGEAPELLRERCIRTAWELRDTGLMTRILTDAVLPEGHEHRDQGA